MRSNLREQETGPKLLSEELSGAFATQRVALATLCVAKAPDNSCDSNLVPVSLREARAASHAQPLRGGQAPNYYRKVRLCLQFINFSRIISLINKLLGARGKIIGL